MTRRLEEREWEQLCLVGRLEEQLRERSEEAAALLSRDEARRLEEEQKTLAEIREGLLLAKEARVDGEDAGEEALRSARERYESFRQEQVQELGVLVEGLSQQRERLEKEVSNDHAALGVLQHAHKEKQRLVGGNTEIAGVAPIITFKHQSGFFFRLVDVKWAGLFMGKASQSLPPLSVPEVRETMAWGSQDSSSLLQEEAQLSQAEHRLQHKERQLLSLHQNHLPAVSEELHRAEEALERVRGRETGGSPEQVEKELDEMLYQVGKESLSG